MVDDEPPLPTGVGDVEWVSPVTQEVDAAMRAEGRTMARLLHQMRVDLPLRDDIVAGTTPITTRSFVADVDDDGWLAGNNRAFRWHPDQGGWDQVRLADRLAEPWVRTDGFLVHDSPDDRRGSDRTDGSSVIDGFCWTREHPATDSAPAMGEIFVIAADPSTAGTGLGRSLTVAGLTHLHERGLDVGMLYVEAINTAALRLYERLGFVVHHSDAAYTCP